jgi:hypothetical protein
MKNLIIILISLVIGLNLLFLDYPYYFSPRNESERIAGFQYPEGSELIFKRKQSAYKIYKWHIPEEHFSSVIAPTNVSEDPFSEFKWSRRQYIEFGEGAEVLLDEDDIASDSESIQYRTSHHAVELIRSESESTIIIMAIYNN